MVWGVDEALLTGESLPLTRQAGDRVIAGSHNLASVVLVRVERTGAQTRRCAARRRERPDERVVGAHPPECAVGVVKGRRAEAEEFAVHGLFQGRVGHQVGDGADHLFLLRVQHHKVRIRPHQHRPLLRVKVQDLGDIGGGHGHEFVWLAKIDVHHGKWCR